jgi:hypothetical protein
MIDAFMKIKNPLSGLWAETKPRNFEKHMLYLTLFKDLENVGFNRLKNSVSSLFLTMYKRSREGLESLMVLLMPKCLMEII